jgi:hypothetical protein
MEPIDTVDGREISFDGIHGHTNSPQSLRRRMNSGFVCGNQQIVPFICTALGQFVPDAGGCSGDHGE